MNPQSPPTPGAERMRTSRLAPPPHAARLPPSRLHPALRSRRALCKRSSLTNCAKEVYNLYSRRRAGKVYPHEIDIQETHPKHRKLDSRATLSHRARGRAADGLCPQVWPLRAVAYRHGLRASEVCNCNGSRSNCPRAACTFTVSRMGFPAYIQSAVMRCEPA